MREIEEKEIEFKTEIVFKGNIRELEKVVNTLEGLKVSVGIKPPFPPWPGFMPIEPKRVLTWTKIDELIKDRPKFLIKDIYGGIRDPHFHIDGGIVFLEEQEFKQLIKDIAVNIAGMIADKGNYIESMDKMKDFASGVIITEG
jgi:hypothetical protein